MRNAVNIFIQINLQIPHNLIAMLLEYPIPSFRGMNPTEHPCPVGFGSAPTYQRRPCSPRLVGGGYSDYDEDHASCSWQGHEDLFPAGHVRICLRFKALKSGLVVPRRGFGDTLVAFVWRPMSFRNLPCELALRRLRFISPNPRPTSADPGPPAQHRRCLRDGDGKLLFPLHDPPINTSGRVCNAMKAPASPAHDLASDIIDSLQDRTALRGCHPGTQRRNHSLGMGFSVLAQRLQLRVVIGRESVGEDLGEKGCVRNRRGLEMKG